MHTGMLFYHMECYRVLIYIELRTFRFYCHFEKRILNIQINFVLELNVQDIAETSEASTLHNLKCRW